MTMFLSVGCHLAQVNSIVCPARYMLIRKICMADTAYLRTAMIISIQYINNVFIEYDNKCVSSMMTIKKFSKMTS